jgi:hypothetical protein
MSNVIIKSTNVQGNFHVPIAEISTQNYKSGQFYPARVGNLFEMNFNRNVENVEKF